MRLEHKEIPAFIIGGLHYKDQFGNTKAPKKIFFKPDPAGEDDENPEGSAFAVTSSELYGEAAMPVFRANGERLTVPGYAGLFCSYNAEYGELNDFYEE